MASAQFKTRTWLVSWSTRVTTLRRLPTGDPGCVGYDGVSVHFGRSRAVRGVHRHCQLDALRFVGQSRLRPRLSTFGEQPAVCGAPTPALRRLLRCRRMRLVRRQRMPHRLPRVDFYVSGWRADSVGTVRSSRSLTTVLHRAVSSLDFDLHGFNYGCAPTSSRSYRVGVNAAGDGLVTIQSNANIRSFRNVSSTRYCGNLKGSGRKTGPFLFQPKVQGRTHGKGGGFRKDPPPQPSDQPVNASNAPWRGCRWRVRRCQSAPSPIR